MRITTTPKSDRALMKMFSTSMQKIERNIERKGKVWTAKPTIVAKAA